MKHVQWSLLVSTMVVILIWSNVTGAGTAGKREVTATETSRKTGRKRAKGKTTEGKIAAAAATQNREAATFTEQQSLVIVVSAIRLHLYG
jgi:hypothetical protein